MGRNSADSKKRHPVNGFIKLASHLGATIRFFVGDDAYDICQVFGISYIEVFNSVEIVLDAVNSCESLEIHFPSNHAEKKKIADKF